MNGFKELNPSKPLLNAISDLGFETPTPIQEAAYPVVLSGKNVVGISQTGTGKTLAYMLPILQGWKFSQQPHPTTLVIVPTRELVIQVVEQIELFAKYMSIRVSGVYGGTNINTQALAIADGMDVLVATPGRLYDLVLNRAVALKSIKRLVIDEVDVMLDLGFRFQLTNIFELLPDRRQNIMFSATMTDDVNLLINDFFYQPVQLSTAVSGTPLENIAQSCFPAPNFHSKANLLVHLLEDADEFAKVLVFVPSKRMADRLYERIYRSFFGEIGIIHSNKSQNTRNNAIEQFNDGTHRILIATDVIARGLDLEKITHVINFDAPIFPENYMHRIGRTGRAKEKGKSILFFSEKEEAAKEAIETLMGASIPLMDWPESVEVSEELIPEEMPDEVDPFDRFQAPENTATGPAFHEKSEKNSKVNLGSRYKREIKVKFKRPKTRGDKNANRRRKK